MRNLGNAPGQLVVGEIQVPCSGCQCTGDADVVWVRAVSRTPEHLKVAEILWDGSCQRVVWRGSRYRKAVSCKRRACWQGHEANIVLLTVLHPRLLEALRLGAGTGADCRQGQTWRSQCS